MTLNFVTDSSEAKGGFVLQYEACKINIIFQISKYANPNNKNHITRGDIFIHLMIYKFIPAEPATPTEECTDPSTCNPCVEGVTFTDTSGVVESPGWPDENYPNSADCRWKIEVDALEYSRVELKLLSFDVEDGYEIKN